MNITGQSTGLYRRLSKYETIKGKMMNIKRVTIIVIDSLGVGEFA